MKLLTSLLVILIGLQGYFFYLNRHMLFDTRLKKADICIVDWSTGIATAKMDIRKHKAVKCKIDPSTQKARADITWQDTLTNLMR